MINLLCPMQKRYWQVRLCASAIHSTASTLQMQSHTSASRKQHTAEAKMSSQILRKSQCDTPYFTIITLATFVTD